MDKHEIKKKIARKMKARTSKVGIFETAGWENRKQGIADRVKKHLDKKSK